MKLVVDDEGARRIVRGWVARERKRERWRRRGTLLGGGSVGRVHACQLDVIIITSVPPTIDDSIMQCKVEGNDIY